MLDLDPASLSEAGIQVSEFITPDKQCDTTKLRSCLPNDIVQLIQGIPLPYTDVEDPFCWVILVVVIFLQNLLLGRPTKISVGNKLYGNITGSGK